MVEKEEKKHIRLLTHIHMDGGWKKINMKKEREGSRGDFPRGGWKRGRKKLESGAGFEKVVDQPVSPQKAMRGKKNVCTYMYRSS